LKWHFQRIETDRIVKKILNEDKESNIICVESTPGSGKKFVILAAIEQMIKNNSALAIKILSHAYKEIPSADELYLYLKEIFNNIKKRGLKQPKYLIFWAEFNLESEQISAFRKLVANFNLECEQDNIHIKMILLYKSTECFNQEINKSQEIEIINLESDLSIDLKQDLALYILKTIRNHRLPEINEDELVKIIGEEKTFLPIIYRTLDPSRRSIDRIFDEIFNAITENELRDLILYCSFSCSIDLDVPFAIIKRALSEKYKRIVTYDELYDLADTESGKSFLNYYYDQRTNPIFSIFHTIIAKHICNMYDKKILDEVLINIAKSAELKSGIEGDFIRNLIIIKGLNSLESYHDFFPFTKKGLENAFSELINRQPARPIIHHFARFYYNINAHHDKIIPLLEQALHEPKEKYSLYERKENVQTTLANYKWEQNKDKFVNESRDNAEIEEIISILKNARENIHGNIHPYDVHAKILLDMIRNKEDIEEKISLMNEAIDIITQGQDECIGDPDGIQRLNERLMEVLLEIDYEEAYDTADNLLIKNNDGTGYYYLALYEYNKNFDNEKAICYLKKSINALVTPNNALLLRIEIDLFDSYNKSPDYLYYLKLLEKLEFNIDFIETWKNTYLMAVVFLINDKYSEAERYFEISRRLSPRNQRTKVNIFWMENGKRKMFKGKIGNLLTERQGHIYSHYIDGWPHDIYFDPRKQEMIDLLEPGMYVNFELGFNSMGPIAFDVRPSRIKKFRE